MGSNKWRLPESLFLASLCLLALFLAGLPLPLPAFLLPERLYLALPREAGPEALREAVGRSKEAWALLGDSLLRLPRENSPASAWREAAAALPERPVFDALLAELGRKDYPALRRARLVCGFAPSAEEVRKLSETAKGAGIPLAIATRLPDGGPGPESWSWRTGEVGDKLDFELLFSLETVSAGLTLDIQALRSPGAVGGSTSLWKGRGDQLPADRVLRLSTATRDLVSIHLRLEGGAGSRTWDFPSPSPAPGSPRVLVIEEGGRGPSFIDSLYVTKHLSPAELGGVDPAAWELIVDDGLPLAKLGGAFSERLARAAAEGRTSLLFAADSADFGKRGDNPALEAVLPVTLLPPSLKDLPDMAILILLDYSGSMFGGKLSLAKVTSLELLHGLKPNDRVGLLLFSDKRRWVWDFVPNRSIEAAPVLDPVEAEGGTELGPALLEGIDRLAATGPGEKHIVLISDGVSRPADFAALAARAREKGITISTMGVGEDLDRPLLEKLAADGGGRFRLVRSADEIPALIFEDRREQARPRFAEGRIPVLDPLGTRVALIGGMAQYGPKPQASVLYANDLGDPLLAERESGRRAVLLFASDLHGGYTKDFFSQASVIATLRDRLDALFTERPKDIAVLESAQEARVLFSGGSLLAPSLELSRPGLSPRKTVFSRRDGKTWEASVSLPATGLWHASLLDRGTSLASFDLPLAPGLEGLDVSSLAALEKRQPLAFRLAEGRTAWLLLFFLLSLLSTLAMRRRR